MCGFSESASRKISCTTVNSPLTSSHILSWLFTVIHLNYWVQAVSLWQGKPEVEVPAAIFKVVATQLELECYPLCQQLMDNFRGLDNSKNKTPLAILHEYASRSNFEVIIRWLHGLQSLSINSSQAVRYSAVVAKSS